MELLTEILRATLVMLLQASPYILFGLLVAGFLHVLLPESLVLRWMGRPGLSGVARAAAIGVPLPVCSCGVVPITVELRRKGASEPAAQSFLITTPESSIDSIFMTWGMMGPVMAVARPIAAFFTAVLGGVLSLIAGRRADRLVESGRTNGEEGTTATGREPLDVEGAPAGLRRDPGDLIERGVPTEETPTAGRGGVETGPADGCDDACGDECTEHALAHPAGDRARAALRRLLPGSGGSRAASSGEPPPRLWPDLVRPALRYGFVDLLNDLAFWLVIGLGMAGILTALLPSDLGELGLGGGILPMVLVLAIGIPLYMCASASTPVAAALLAKGVSPGAALVLLLAGPATNAASLLLLAGTFGRRFVKIYLASVALGALASGLALDALLGALGVSPTAIGAPTGESFGWVSWSLTALLAGLLAWRLWHGGWRMGVGELRGAWRRLRPRRSPERRRPAAERRQLAATAILAILAGAVVATAIYSLLANASAIRETAGVRPVREAAASPQAGAADSDRTEPASPRTPGRAAEGASGESGAAGAGAGSLEVAVSIAPQAWLVERIGGPRTVVHTLVAPGDSPHTYQPTDAQITRVARADVYFRIGVAFESGPWFRAIAGAGRPWMADLRDGIELHEADHAHGPGPTGGGDPHIWLSPRRLARQAATVAATLSEIDPRGATEYKARLAAVERELAELDAELARILAPAAGTSFFVHHPSWGYLAADYGLRQVAIEHDGKEPSDGELTRLVRQARHAGVGVVFVEPRIRGAAARALAAAIGARVEAIDPLAADLPGNLRRVARELAAARSGASPLATAGGGR